MLHERDERLLIASIDLARKAREHGNHPFGAVLATASGEVLCEAENTVVIDDDVTRHAELNLVSLASRTLGADQLASATLYASTEPCAMCSGAIYWSRIPRVVYGLGGDDLAVLAAGGSEHTLHLSSRDVFAGGSPQVEVSGPHLRERARAVHEGGVDAPVDEGAGA